MWDLKDIKNRKKFVKKSLKDCKNYLEKEKILLTFESYDSMFDDVKINSLNSIEKKFYNIFTNLRNNINNRKFDVKQTIDEDYYLFLMRLCFSIMSRNDIVDGEISYKKMNIKLKDMIDISLDFYKQLDIDIYNVVRYLYNKKGHILCKNRSINNNHLYGAITFHDYVFHDSFILIYLNNNITDLLNINHEIMHAFEFKENPKSPSNNYFGFHEVSTNTIDILFIEYLVKQGFNKKELYNIYNNSICRTKYFCEEVLCRIMDKINVDFGDSFIDVFNYDKVKDVLDLEIKYKLLGIESMVLGNCISNKISDDKKNINILKNFIYSKIDSNSIPDFSKYNISNEYMINYCLDTKKMIKKI